MFWNLIDKQCSTRSDCSSRVAVWSGYMLFASILKLVNNVRGWLKQTTFSDAFLLALLELILEKQMQTLVSYLKVIIH